MINPNTYKDISRVLQIFLQVPPKDVWFVLPTEQPVSTKLMCHSSSEILCFYHKKHSCKKLFDLWVWLNHIQFNTSTITPLEKSSSNPWNHRWVWLVALSVCLRTKHGSQSQQSVIGWIIHTINQTIHLSAKVMSTFWGTWSNIITNIPHWLFSVRKEIPLTKNITI